MCVICGGGGANLINSTCTLVTRKIIIANKQQINSCLHKKDLEITNSINNTSRKKKKKNSQAALYIGKSTSGIGNGVSKMTLLIMQFA